LAYKEEELTKLQVVLQECRKAKPPSIAIVEANTMTMITLVISPSIKISQEYLGEFEMHTRGIGLKFLRQASYDRQWLGKRIQCILSHIEVE